MNDEEFIQKLKKEANFTHSGYQKEILWGRLQAYIDTPSSRGFWHFGFRFAYVAVFAFGVLLTSAGVTFASQSSLPGEPLYPVMRWSEEAVIFVKFDETEKKKARVELTTKRADEVNRLIVEYPEKAEEVLVDYESQIQNYMDDPELSDTLEVTIVVNREYFIKAEESAPEQMKLRLRALIEEDTKSDTEEGTVERETTNYSDPANIEETSSSEGAQDSSETSSPQP